MRSYRNIFILTGAGISAPSGVQTFRGADGLWNGHKIDDVATNRAFEETPNRVHAFYNERRDEIRLCKPNAAHLALGKLFETTNNFESENELDAKVTLVTQNIDDLHERGGFESTVHMHGNIFQRRCVDCWHIEEYHGDSSVGDMCIKCNGRIRPNIVWFGESPFELMFINRYLKKCDLFLSIGTSSQVAPACDFVVTAKEHGAYTIELNLEKTIASDHYDQCILGDVALTVPKLIDEILLKAQPIAVE